MSREHLETVEAAEGLPLILGGETLQLLPARAVWWPSRRTLIVADVHLGKGAHFRASGQAVPTGSTQASLQRLTRLIACRPVDHLVVLGDWVHSHRALDASGVARLQAWHALHERVSFTLVRGNHERTVAAWPPRLPVCEVTEPYAPDPAVPLRWAHHPQAVVGALVLAGHWHPGITLQGAGNDRLRLPCFVRHDHGLVLPAFGDFTGSTSRAIPARAQYYAIAGDRVMALPPTGRFDPT